MVFKFLIFMNLCMQCMVTELCVPGFKALVRLATDNQLDLETVELKPTEKMTFQKDIGKLSFHLKKGVQVNELMTMLKEGEFKSLKHETHQAQLLEVANRMEKATVTKVLVQEASDRRDRNIGLKSVMRTLETGEESMEQIIMDVSKEFGPSSEPVKEIAAVGHLLQEGVKCDEVVTLVEAGLLPSLKKPQSQVPLVSMVAEKGHVGSVCEVLVEESTKEMKKPKPKFEAARMSEVKEMLKKAKSDSVDVKSKFYTNFSWKFIAIKTNSCLIILVLSLFSYFSPILHALLFPLMWIYF